MKLFKVELERSAFSTDWQPKTEVHYIQAESQDDINGLLSQDTEANVRYITELGEVT